MTRDLVLACYRSGQIEPDEMVRLCRDDPALLEALEATTPLMDAAKPGCVE